MRGVHQLGRKWVFRKEGSTLKCTEGEYLREGGLRGLFRPETGGGASQGEMGLWINRSRAEGMHGSWGKGLLEVANK